MLLLGLNNPSLVGDFFPKAPLSITFSCAPVKEQLVSYPQKKEEIEEMSARNNQRVFGHLSLTNTYSQAQLALCEPMLLIQVGTKQIHLVMSPIMPIPPQFGRSKLLVIKLFE